MQIVFSWVYTGVVVFWLYRGYVGVIALRRKFFSSTEYQAAINSRTLLVHDVPKPVRTDQNLAQLAARFKPETVHFAQAHIGRDVGDLTELLEQHEKAVKHLEKYLAVYLKNPNKLPDKRPTCKPKHKDGKVDAIDYYTERSQALEEQIEATRQSMTQRKTTQYGFVSYHTIPSAHIVAQAQKRKHIQGTTVSLAPKANDILWKNLSIPKARRKTNRIIGNLLFFAFSVVWIVPNALFAAFVSNLYNLGTFWPAFGAELNRHTKLWAIVQGFLGPIILALFFLVLPTVMRRLTAWSGALTKSERERSVTHKLYFFLYFPDPEFADSSVLNNIIIFTLFGIVWGFVAQVYSIQTATGNTQSLWDTIKAYHLLDNISHAIIQTSSFWIMYLIAR
jgi:calcium permeable stress-gated cation channel